MSIAAVAAKAAAVILSDEKLRKGVGWILVAVLSPLILLLAILCSVLGGGSDHNNATVQACFYGLNITAEVPEEFRAYVTQMQSVLLLLDSAAADANSRMPGGGLDPLRVKAAYYVLCPEGTALSSDGADSFVDCFYAASADGTPTPLSLEGAYARLAVLLGREITEEDRSSVQYIYTMIAGPAGGAGGGSVGGGGGGFYEAGGSRNTELDVSAFTAPATKNAADLVAYAIHAWESGWGYVWGTFGNVLTESQFESKLAQYPDGVGAHEEFIRDNWVDGRATDCCGLIKGYGWLNAETLELEYGTNGMPDITANQMYHAASESGPIDTIPETPGLAVWFDGHIGVYIGNGQVIEAMGTRYGVVKTNLSDGVWTHWLKVPYIQY